MSQYRVQKRKAAAELLLSNGRTVCGSFFLASSSAHHPGPERIIDLLNEETGFFPFECEDQWGADTTLYNRAQIAAVKVLDKADEGSVEIYEFGTERRVGMMLTTGLRVEGTIRVYLPVGRDRLSDYVRTGDRFRYIEAADGILIINFAHVVEIREAAPAQ